MNYCTGCGRKVTLQMVAGDDRPRFVCDNCGTIHYQNPKMVVGAIPEVNGKILFCRRAIEPRKNSWTLPAGYLENGETASQGAQREAMEEAYAELDNVQPYALLNITAINQIYMIFRAQLINTDFRAGTESLEVKLFEPNDIPWDELAFPVINDVLRVYCKDLQRGVFPFRELETLGRMSTTPQVAKEK
ncbi:NUDIX hydrolase [Desulfogranum marinum]|jgi:ADP-ribose pyrophosphatase YjhB (NUDIX family)|uniref:NUDIX hydrolase n=1 Tax=Desulfogranum marinum TaxID=453220 RepID=UPI001E4B5D6C|nr:NUDIX hydrolase [Desulfogranum marinum]